MQIDWWTLALQTINFLVVVWLLSRFLYRPVRRMIAERETADRAAAEAAEAKAAEAEKVRQDYEEKRAALEGEMTRREAELHAAMARERDGALAAARAEAERMRADAAARIAREEEEALDSLKDRITDLAATLATRALEGRGTAGTADLETLQRRIAEMQGEVRAALSRDLRQGGRGLTVVLAAPLTAADEDGWRKGLTEALGGGFAIAFEVEPTLIGGAELRFPHAVLSDTVADRLRRAVDELGG